MTRFLLLCLAVGALAGAPAWAESGPPDGATVVVFSRHTFRGVGHTIGQQPVLLPQFNIDLSLPMLSYGMEATDHGLVLAERFGPAALNQAAAKAVEGLSPARAFDGQWDEIRADLCTSRTFFTALYFRAGLQPAQKKPILLTGCPTKEGEGVDVVTICRPVQKCIPLAELRRLQASSPNLARLRQAGEALLNLVGPAIGKPGPFPLPPLIDTADNSVNPAYSQLTTLASTIEMTSEQGPPLGLLFPRAPRDYLRQADPQAVRTAGNYLGVLFAAMMPTELICACSIFPIEYINSTPPGRHVIALAHDTDLSSLSRALGIVSDEGDISELAMHPMESFVFALNSSSVCIVRMRMQISADGSLAGPFESRRIWQGTRAEWDQKVKSVTQRAQAWKAGAEERAKIRILPAPALDVLYQTTR